MPVYVVEAEGRAVAAIEAPTLAEAEQHADSLGFQVSLMTLTRNGRPLWSGESQLQLRAPSDREQQRWDATAPSPSSRLDPEQWISALVPFCEDE